MTNEQQQIEVWRAEFESTVDKPHLLHRLPSGTYSWDSTEWMWAGFQRSKRTLPVIEITAYDMHHYAPVRNIMAQLSAAGYQYKVKE